MEELERNKKKLEYNLVKNKRPKLQKGHPPGYPSDEMQKSGNPLGINVTYIKLAGNYRNFGYLDFLLIKIVVLLN